MCRRAEDGIATRPCEDAAHQKRGLTLVEALLALTLSAILMLALSNLVGVASTARASIQEQNELSYDLSFAMDRMVALVAHCDRLLVPQDDRPATAYRENFREQTVPASAPESGSSLATAVLACTIDPTQDLDHDGFPDADNDEDGRIDEDPSWDATNDGEPGIAGLDDGGNGQVDEGFFFNTGDDDEYLGASDEDPIDGIDNDGDGRIDEDPPSDQNGDNAPGIAGVDDDGDGQIDEGNDNDDDEDGQSDEDWLDVGVFYMSGSSLYERVPVPWDQNGSGSVTGTDFVALEAASDLTHLRFERVPRGDARAQLVKIFIEKRMPSGTTGSLSATVRVGARR